MDCEEDATNPFDKYGVVIPEDYVGLFNEPPLMEGDDPSRYRRLLAAAVNEQNPQSFSEWMSVFDTVTRLCEETNLKRAANALLEGEKWRAAMNFYSDYGREGKKTGLAPSFKEAHPVFDLFGDNAEKKAALTARLAKYGVTSATLMAKAAQQNRDAFQMLEGMRSSRARERRHIALDAIRFRKKRKSNTAPPPKKGN
jgi:hypothetical protein